MKIIKGDIRHGRFAVPYRIYGDAKETIICISGAKQTMAAWRSFISHFSPQYSVVVFDLPGQGRASFLSGKPEISFEEQQEVLLEVINKTNRNGKVILAAASWGTIISAAVAAKHPELVSKMVLGSFGVKPNRETLRLIREGRKLFVKGRSDEIAQLMISGFGQHIPDSQKRQIVNQFSNMTREEFLSFGAHCKFVEQASHLEEFIDLENINAKTLIINGEYDSILDHQGIKQASYQIPNCVFKLVPGAGHFLHWEKPEILTTYSDFFSA
jgi:pimeloyl-ACP methyl ester carboxylesterase